MASNEFIDVVEEENLEPSGTPLEPYDPNQIRIDHQSVNLGFLLEKLEYQEIDLNPEFQRAGNLWSPTKMGQLIESILLGLPLPSFYFSVSHTDDKWQVVDGLQRLSTLQRFWVQGSLKLEGLEFLRQYEGSTRADLTRAELRKISGFKVNFYVIEKETPKEAKFLIFRRVNTGGLVLTSQEMRNALNHGVPARFIERLSLLPSFKLATDNRIPSERQLDREFVNRFVAFYLLSIEKDYDGDLDVFLNRGMIALENKTEIELVEIETAFDNAMTTAHRVFDDNAFRKIREQPSGPRKPINKSIFDSLGVSLGRLSEAEQTVLVANKDLFISDFSLLLQEDPYHQAISSGTGKKRSILTRFSFVQSLLKKFLAYHG